MARYLLFGGEIPDTAGTYTGDVITGLSGTAQLLAQAAFVAGSGGTSVDVYLQTSLDGGATWCDIMQFSFGTSDDVRLSTVSAAQIPPATTPTDGALAANSVLDGVIGDQLRAKIIVAGSYTGAELWLHVEAKEAAGGVGASSSMRLDPDREEIIASIANGQSESGGLDLGAKTIVAIRTPNNWTTAKIGVLGSHDGVDFKPVFNAAGVPIETGAAIAANSWVAFYPGELSAFRYIKLYSGSNSSRVNQPGVNLVLMVQRV